MKNIWQRFKEFATSRDALMFIVFVMFSAMLWLSRNHDNQRQHTMTLHINYLGIGPEIDFNDSLPKTLKLDFTDSERKFFYTQPKVRTISIDLSEQINNQNIININTGKLTEIIKDQMPQTITILRTEPAAIQASFTRLDSKTVPVVFAGKIKAAPQYQLEGETIIDPNSIIIYGQTKRIDTIQHVLTLPEQITNVQENYEQDIALQPLPNVRLSQPTVKLQAHAIAFTETSLTLPIIIIGKPEGTEIKTFPSEVNVKMQLGIDTYRNLKNDDVKAMVNYNDMLTSQNGMVKVYIATESSHIFNLKATPENVEFIIEE